MPRTDPAITQRWGTRCTARGCPRLRTRVLGSSILNRVTTSPVTAKIRCGLAIGIRFRIRRPVAVRVGVEDRREALLQEPRARRDGGHGIQRLSLTRQLVSGHRLIQAIADSPGLVGARAVQGRVLRSGRGRRTTWKIRSAVFRSPGITVIR